MPNNESLVPILTEGLVLLDLRPDGVAHIRLNRPESANSLDTPMLKALHGAVMFCHSDPRVRAVVLTGAGKNFCAGGDVKGFASKGEKLPDHVREVGAWLETALGSLIRLKAPVVAAVQGFAAGGGGLGLVCASDFVVAAESSKFLAGATRVAMVPDGGVTVSLIYLVGLRQAMEILLLNPTVSARDAKEMRLISRVVPDERLETEALELAGTLARGAPAAIAATKRLVWSGLGTGVDARMPEEARTIAELCASADVREGLAAVIERREPRFTGR